MIITSLLDQDLYKFFMMQITFHKFSNVEAEWEYKLRNEGIEYSEELINDFVSEMNMLCDLRFQKDEIQYLRDLGYFKEDFLQYLSVFQLNLEHMHLDTSDGFKLTFKGSNLMIKMFEIFTMEIISELYFDQHDDDDIIAQGHINLTNNIRLIKQNNELNNNTPIFKFAEFGGRRRRSRNWHQYVLERFTSEIPHNLLGTSNVFFAKRFGIKPIGTMAHSYLQMMQSQVRLIDSQKYAFECWSQEYRGELGIALTDVINMDTFLKDFDLYFCKLFDGARHDSGDPHVWCDKLIAHYEKMGIDPLSKTAVFSDGLTFPLAIELVEHYKFKIKTFPAIGTKCTNDFGDKALNHVLKMVKCDGVDVAKISDSDGKTMCRNPEYVNYLKSVFNVK